MIAIRDMDMLMVRLGFVLLLWLGFPLKIEIIIIINYNTQK